jgi:hypothetical protein
VAKDFGNGIAHSEEDAMRRETLKIVCCWVLLALALGGGVSAQTPTTGQISGMVYDPSGAAVAGATVSLTSEAGVRREATSDVNGRYVFPLVPPGRYRLQARASGFEEVTFEGVMSRITAITNFDIHLVVAGRKEAVVVSTEAPLVQTEAAVRGQVIPSDTLRQLPLPTRNFQQLLTLTPGTLNSIPNSSDLGRGDTVFNVNGQRSLSNAVVINGVDANSIGTGSTPNLAVPASDTLQEFIVQTSQYDASQGRNAGSIVAAVTRSGTNDYHGNFYYFLRNDALNANNFFLNANNISRPDYKRHQFGGTFGGPLKRDRAWFFISYQGTRERNSTSQTHSLAGVFVPQNLSDDRTTATLTALSAAWGVAVPHPTALAVLQLVLPDGSLAVPSAANPTTCAFPSCTSVFRPVVGKSKFTEDQFNGNLDWQVTTGNRLSGKSFWANNPTKQALFNSFGIGNALPLPGFGADVDFKQRLVSVTDTHLFSAGLLNEARFGYSRISTRSVPEEPFTSAQVGITSPLSTLFPGMPTISVSNFFDVGSSPFADNDAQVWTLTAGDTVTWRKGRHTIKAGAEFKRHAVDLRFDLYTRGNVFHLGFSGNPFRDFLGGFFGLQGLSIMGSGVNNRSNRAWDFSGFFTDDWRVSDQFTLTFGVRYEYFAPFTEVNGRYVGFDPSLQATAVIPPQPGFTTSPGVAITGGFVQAGNASTPLPGIPTVRDSLVEPDKNNFGPRIGFAWQPFGQSKRFVVRGGYGFYFDRPNARLYNNQILNFPYYTLAQPGFASTTIANPFVQVPLPSTFPLQFNNASTFPQGGPPAVLPAPVAASACAPAGFTCVPANGLYPDIHNFRMPYVQQWSFGFQYEFVQNWSLDLSYVGSAGRKLHRLAALNQGLAPGGPGSLSPGLSALAAQGFGVHVVQSSAVSSYNSLQASLTKRFSYGLDFLVSYTYGHSLDDYSGDASGTSDNSVVPGDQRPDRFRNYASSDFDRRHRLVFSGIYTMPNFYKGDSGFAKQTLNDWQFAAIITTQTGAPFSVLTNATAFVQARANFAGTCTASSATFRGSVHGRLSRYFDTSCFASASGVGNFGNTGRNILRGPDQRNIDFSVVKFFPIDEQMKFEFRTEFFNLTNTPSFANPVNSRASANFGQIVRTTTGSRVIQFAFKFNF